MKKYINLLDNVFFFVLIFLFIILLFLPYFTNNSNAQTLISSPWVKIETNTSLVWIKRDKIVYVGDHKDKKLREYQGKAMISLMNGKEFYFDNYNANQLIDIINR